MKGRCNYCKRSDGTHSLRCRRKNVKYLSESNNHRPRIIGKELLLKTTSGKILRAKLIAHFKDIHGNDSVLLTNLSEFRPQF